MKKELGRDLNNKIIAGVCSGIANYLDIDPVIIRLIWAAAIFLFGTGFLFYIICWIIIPEESKW
jgi:phage shock protein PspC (stress-responsive transcriptional regulator)